MNLAKRISLTIVAIIGFITSLKLAVIYWDVNFNPYAMPSFCSVNDFIDCDGVAKDVHSQYFGIPLAFWGLFLYFVFLFFTYVDKLKNIQIKGFRIFAYFDVFKNPEAYICALGEIAFLISISLACLSVFEIQKICVLCFFTYFLNLLIAIIAKPKGENLFSVIVISAKDLISGLKVKRYAILFSALVVAAASLLTYTTMSNVLAPQVKIQKEYAKKANSYGSVTGNILGDENATLVVHEYTDYQCPYCFVLNTMMHRAVSELKNLKVVHHNLPLDMECNSMLKSQMHPGSCLLSKYAIAAGLQGKYWDMNNMLFDKEFVDEDDVLKAAKDIKGLDLEKLKSDAHGEKVDAELKKEIKESIELGIEGTPAIRINMETHVGIIPYEELKEKLIKAGAVEK